MGAGRSGIIEGWTHHQTWELGAGVFAGGTEHYEKLRTDAADAEARRREEQMAKDKKADDVPMKLVTEIESEMHELFPEPVKRKMENTGPLGLLPHVLCHLFVFRINFRGHFKNSGFHSVQNCDFRMCVCVSGIQRL